MKVLIWLVEGTWQGCIDAAAQHIPAEALVAVLHVSSSELPHILEDAQAGLLGRVLPERNLPAEIESALAEAAADILTAAAQRLGRDDVERLSRRGRVEREVVNAASESVDLLIIARDGDRSRLGPHSLAPATRFVVDHAPCSVLLVWPEEAPGINSMPPPPSAPGPPQP